MEDMATSLRCIDGYTKLGLVGQGGNASVWLAETPETIVALKQFPKKHAQDTNSSIKIELEFQKTLFPGAIGTRDYQIEESLLDKYPGYDMISRLIDYVETDEDIWLVYQPGGKTLGHRLCNIKTEERGNGERIFSIEHSVFYERLNTDI